jgi:hypothetical protein
MLMTGVDGGNSTIAGGKLNVTCFSNATIAGGVQNKVICGNFATVGGGFCNCVYGEGSAVVGGFANIACGSYSGSFGCGIVNSIACSFASNQLWACNLVGTTVAVCVGTDGVLVRGASDCRLKTNICGISYGLCDVKKLNPVSFNWNDAEKATRGTEKQLGFIAQEVEPIIPEAVGKSAETDEYSFSSDKIIPVLTKGLQELLARVEVLEDIIKRNNLI